MNLSDAIVFSFLSPLPGRTQGGPLSEADKRRLYEQNSRLSADEIEWLYGNPFAPKHQPATDGAPGAAPRRNVRVTARALLTTALRALSMPS